LTSKFIQFHSSSRKCSLDNNLVVSYFGCYRSERPSHTFLLKHSCYAKVLLVLSKLNGCYAGWMIILLSLASYLAGQLQLTKSRQTWNDSTHVYLSFFCSIGIYLDMPIFMTLVCDFAWLRKSCLGLSGHGSLPIYGRDGNSKVKHCFRGRTADSESYINFRCTKLKARLEARGNNVRVEMNTKYYSDSNMNMIFLYRCIDHFTWNFQQASSSCDGKYSLERC
jgi:hypothetical protein